MNKQSQTYYAIVNAEVDVPKNTSAVFVICKDKRDGAKVIDTTWYFGKHGFQIEEDGLLNVTHWLSEQQGIILSVEEYKELLDKISRLERYLAEYDKDYASKHGIV